MRAFRKSRENLRDIRIAYTFLITVAVVATILGVLVTKSHNKLNKNELSQLRGALNLCADSLGEWTNDGGAEKYYRVSARLLRGISSLPDEIRIDGLITLGERIEKGEAEADEVRSFADTFSLLSALDYTDAHSAEEIVAAALFEICTAVYPDLASGSDKKENAVMPEVAAYSKKIARRTIDNIFGGKVSGLEVEKEGEGLTAQTGNLRMCFSPVDGSLEEFVYIRIEKQIHGREISEAERTNRARDFFISVARRGEADDIAVKGEVCGFLIVDISAGAEIWRTTVDRDGEIWSFFKLPEV